MERHSITTGSLALLFGWVVIATGGGTRTGLTAPATDDQVALRTVLTPDRVVWISTWRPDESFADEAGVWVGYGPGDTDSDCCHSYRGLASFDVSGIPRSVTIESVELRGILVRSHGTEERTYNIAQVTESWSEGSLGWDNQPGRQGPVASARVGQTSGVVSWTGDGLRNLVRGWVDGTIANHGVYLRRAGDESAPEHDRLFRDLQLAVTFQATAQPDLTISHVELTQAVQDWNNNIPLVQRKRTVVRVYVSACCQVADLQDVGVSLEGQRPLGTRLGKIGPQQPRGNRLSIPGLPVDPLTLRGDETRTFNFVLPTSWTEEEKVWLTATVNGSHRVAESHYGNNARRPSPSFHQRPELDLVGVIVWGTTELGYTYPPVTFDHFDPHAEWAKRVYPVPGVRVWRVGGFDQLEYQAELGADGVLTDLTQRRLMTGSAPDPRVRDLAQIQWYGLDSWTGFEQEICDALGCRLFGVADTVLDATGMDTPAGYGSGEILAHELAHNRPFGRVHASDQCTNWPFTDDGNYCDKDYPVADGCLDEYGFDTVDMRAMDPGGGTDPCLHDIMSYTHPQWVSAYTYKALYSAAADLPVPGQAESKEATPHQPSAVLLASGLVTQDGRARMRPFYVVRSAVPLGPGPGSGDYSLTLEDAGGRVLAERRFDAGRTVGPRDIGGGVGVFGVRVSWHDETARVFLRRGGDVLGVRQVSPNAPEVAVLSPGGGETWTGQHEVRWRAGDGDGDPLTFLVLLSTDGGGSWQPVGANVRGSSYMLNAEGLPGSDRAMIRVVATDGVRSNHGDSAAFTIPYKRPQVRIAESSRRRVIENPYSVSLGARAYDVEDGPLSGARVTWVSSRDGELGHGNDVVVAELSRGMHTIVATATDSDGNVATDRVRVSVAPGWPYDLFLPLARR